jgi:hypothetical protein
MNQSAVEFVRMVVKAHRKDMIDYIDKGLAPIRAISHLLADILGTQYANSRVGREISIELRPAFKPCGRQRWDRENGTESGALYCRV